VVLVIGRLFGKVHAGEGAVPFQGGQEPGKFFQIGGFHHHLDPAGPLVLLETDEPDAVRKKDFQPLKDRWNGRPFSGFQGRQGFQPVPQLGQLAVARGRDRGRIFPGNKEGFGQLFFKEWVLMEITKGEITHREPREDRQEGEDQSGGGEDGYEPAQWKGKMGLEFHRLATAAAAEGGVIPAAFPWEVFTEGSPTQRPPVFLFKAFKTGSSHSAGALT